MQVGLDGPERALGLAGDLLEGQLAEEAQRHDLAVWLLKSGDGRAEFGRMFGPKR